MLTRRRLLQGPKGRPWAKLTGMILTSLLLVAAAVYLVFLAFGEALALIVVPPVTFGWGFWILKKVEEYRFERKLFFLKEGLGKRMSLDKGVCIYTYNEAGHLTHVEDTPSTVH